MANPSMELFDRIDDILVEAGFDRNNLEHYAHYRQFCPDDPSSGESINAPN